MVVKWLAQLLTRHHGYKHLSVEAVSRMMNETLDDADKINTNFLWSAINVLLRKEKILPDPISEEDEVIRTPDWTEVCEDVYCFGWDQNDNTVYLKELFQKEVELRPFSEYKEWL